ncbi:hypothetical protein ACIP27_23220, partial [Streptomyces hydrogenans]
VNVHLTPAPSPVLTVSVDFNDGQGMRPVLQTPAPEPVPSTYKFGFAASTGLFTDVHLIRNVAVSTEQPLPELNLVKQVHEPRPGELVVGTPVAYDFVVTNSGDTPINDIAVHDPTVGDIDCPATLLEPGRTITCTGTYLITATDVARGRVTNTARATGTSGGDPVTSPDSTVEVPIEAPPGMTLVKSVDAAEPFDIGDTVPYSYVVTNEGGTEISSLAITDDRVTGITCDSAALAPAGSPGDSTTCHGTYTVTADDARTGQVTNTAKATGASDGRPIESPPTEATISVVGTSSLGLAKKADTEDPVRAGQTVTYTYTVTNTGRTTLDDLAVHDDHAPDVTCEATTLTAGEDTTCRATYRVTEADLALGHLTNQARATATDPRGATVLSPFAEVTLDVVGVSKLTVTKKADTAGPVEPGDRIAYTYTVTNEGSTTLESIAVTDDRAANVVCEPTTLAPGARATCRATYTVTEEDALAGHVTNIARATGTDPDGATVESPPVRLRIPAACPADDHGYGDEGCKAGDHGYGDSGYGDSRDKTAQRPGKETVR